MWAACRLLQIPPTHSELWRAFTDLALGSRRSAKTSSASSCVAEVTLLHLGSSQKSPCRCLLNVPDCKRVYAGHYFGERQGSCRTDLLDHVIVRDERHLKRLLRDYVRYYHDDRTHLGLAKQTPEGRIAVSTAGGRRVSSTPRLGGIHHRYDLAA